MLHIINSFPLSSSILDGTSSGDTVIFTENAVLAVKQENAKTQSLGEKSLRHINLCVRKADLAIRNISNRELLRGVVVIDDVQFEDATAADFAFKSYN